MNLENRQVIQNFRKSHDVYPAWLRKREGVGGQTDINKLILGKQKQTSFFFAAAIEMECFKIAQGIGKC